MPNSQLCCTVCGTRGIIFNLLSVNVCVSPLILKTSVWSSHNTSFGITFCVIILIQAIGKNEKLLRANLKGCYRIGECFVYTALATRFGFRRLKWLDVRDTSIGDSEVTCFGRLPNIRHLLLGHTTSEPFSPPQVLGQLNSLLACCRWPAHLPKKAHFLDHSPFNNNLVPFLVKYKLITLKSFFLGQNPVMAHLLQELSIYLRFFYSLDLDIPRLSFLQILNQFELISKMPFRYRKFQPTGWSKIWKTKVQHSSVGLKILLYRWIL